MRSISMHFIHYISFLVITFWNSIQVIRIGRWVFVCKEVIRDTDKHKCWRSLFQSVVSSHPPFLRADEQNIISPNEGIPIFIFQLSIVVFFSLFKSNVHVTIQAGQDSFVKKIRIVIVKLWLKSGENWKWEISMVVNRENGIRTSWNLMKTKRLNNHTKMCCSFLNFTRKWIEIFKALFHENGRGESIVYESYETNWAVTIHKIIKDSLPR